MKSPGPIDVRKQNEDDSMRTASEVVQYLNETRCNNYELSEQLDFGGSTLRARLKQWGYAENHVGVWMYEGNASMEPADADGVTSKR